MIPFEEMPQDNRELAQIEIDFPRLKPDSAERCPVPVEEILEYLKLECPGGEELRNEDMKFCRTALVEGFKYWIWSFYEPDGGRPAYATVAKYARWLIFNRTTIIGYETNDYGLSPEQYILGNYHRCF